MKKKYKLTVDSNFEAVLAMVDLIKENQYNGLYWPNHPDNIHEFELDLEEDQLLAVMLKIPCRLIK